MFSIRLPFDSDGQEIAVTQGPGEGSHGDPLLPQLYYSWDFVLPNRSQVLAVADGVVVDIRSTVPEGIAGTVLPNMDGDGNPSNDDPSLGSGGIGNIVTIRHEVDGQTFYSSYFHLAGDSIPFTSEDVIAETAKVKAGDFIGETGLTGSRIGETGAHLHFQIGATAGFFGSTNFGGWPEGSDNARPQFIALATPENEGLVNFVGYGENLPDFVIGISPDDTEVRTPTITGSFQLNTTEIGPQMYAENLALSDSNFLTVWRTRESSQGTVARLFNKDGPIGDEFSVSDLSRDYGFLELASGEIVLINTNTSFFIPRVNITRLQVNEATGEIGSDEVTIRLDPDGTNSINSLNVNHQQAVALPDDGIALILTETSEEDFIFITIDDQSELGIERRLDLKVNGTADIPNGLFTAVTSEAGSILLFWGEVVGSPFEHDPAKYYMQELSQDGDPLGVPILITDQGARFVPGIEVLVLPNGNLFASWVERDAETFQYSISGRVLQPNGEPDPTTSDLRLENATGNYALAPYEDGVLIIYTERDGSEVSEKVISYSSSGQLAILSDAFDANIGNRADLTLLDTGEYVLSSEFRRAEIVDGEDNFDRIEVGAIIFELSLSPIQAIDVTSFDFAVRFDGSGFDATRATAGTFVEVGGTHYLFYSGTTFANTNDLGLAISTDGGTTWTKQSDQQLVPANEEPVWATQRLLPIRVLHEDGVFKLWYWGNNTNLFTDSGNQHGFGYASSTDGLNWTFEDTPIRIASGPNQGARLLEVVKVNGTYLAYYDDLGSGQTYLATSANGIDFTGPDQVVAFGAEYKLVAGTEDPDDPQSFLGIWQNRDTGDYVATTSSTGTTFDVVANFTFPSEFSPEDIAFDGSEITFFGRVNEGNVNWSFGNISVATASAPFALTPGDPPSSNNAPEATGSDVLLSAGASIPLASLFVWSDPDGLADIVSFAVRDRTDGSGYLTLDGIRQADGLLFDEQPIGDIDRWAFVAGASGEIDEIGFNAMDAAGAFNSPSALATVTANAAPPENEAPSLNLSQSLAVLAGETFVYDFNATDDQDAEGDGLFYSTIGGADQNAFVLDAITGELSLKFPAEVAPFSDADGDGVYEVSVNVTDRGGLSDSSNIRVTIEEDPISEGWKLFLQQLDFSDVVDEAGLPILLTWPWKDGQQLYDPYELSSSQRLEFLATLEALYRGSAIARSELDKFAGQGWTVDVRGISQLGDDDPAGSRYVPDRNALFIDFNDFNSLKDSADQNYFFSKSGTFTKLSEGTVIYHELLHAIDDFSSIPEPAVEDPDRGPDYSDPSFDHLGSVVSRTNLVRSELGEAQRGGYLAGPYSASTKQILETEWSNYGINLAGSYDQVIINRSVDTSGRYFDGRGSNDLIVIDVRGEVSNPVKISTGDGNDTVLASRAGNIGAFDFVELGSGNDRVWGLDGNDKILGGDGHDQSFYRNSITAYTVYLNSAGQVVIDHDGYDQVDRNDGTDTLTDVEEAIFIDASLDLTTVKNVILAPEEAATIKYAIEDFDGISIEGFAEGDALEFVNVNFDVRSLTVTYGSAILDIDVDLDGVTDATVTLLGNFEGSEFQVIQRDGNTLITVLFPPDAKDDFFSVDEDTVLAGNVLADNGNGADEDPDDDPLVVALVSGPSNGSLLLGENGAFSYTPDVNFNGMDGFTYSIEDPEGGFDSAEVNITIDPLNDAPVAMDDTADVLEDGSVFIDVLANDSDPDGNDTLTIVSATSVSGSTVTISDGMLIYSADADLYDLLEAGEEVTDQISYTIEDDFGELATATVTVSITGAPDGEIIFGTKKKDNLTGTDGEDTIYAENGKDMVYAGDGADTVYGGNGRDKLFGEGSIDTLYGENGDDLLAGGNGNDFLFGGRGNDTLHGGPGDDELTGGKGDDVFILALGEGTDTVLDFGVGDDIFGLQGMTHGDLEFGQMGSDATISSHGELLALVVGVDSVDFSESDFVFVA